MESEKRRIVLPTGDEVEGRFVGIVESTERFTDIKLEDGTILKVKLSVSEVAKSETEKDENNNPLYYVKTQVVVTVAKTSKEQ